MIVEGIIDSWQGSQVIRTCPFILLDAPTYVCRFAEYDLSSCLKTNTLGLDALPHCKFLELKQTSIWPKIVVTSYTTVVSIISLMSSVDFVQIT